MAPWRDVRDERVVNARFVDGPSAGVGRTFATAPDGGPPPLIRLDDALEPNAEGSIIYELVDLGASNTALGQVTAGRRRGCRGQVAGASRPVRSRGEVLSIGLLHC